ncbi:MAG: response regulator transcription factor [Alphaproteobacteria bacterium]|nr:response regulator transcription factor [Alphaproteobacteria bacterium]
MRLLLADDHTLFRDALVQYIERAEPEAQVLTARDFHEALEMLREKSDQDLILLDLRMPGMNGMEGFKKIRAAYPKLPVALMSGVAEREDVQAAMDAGAVAYFPKTLSGKALLKAIQLVLAGEKFVPLDSKSNTIMPSYYAGSMDKQVTLPGHLQARKEPAQVGSGYGNEDNILLTRREREVLSHLARGASNKEIANILGLQVVTVKLHVRGLCRKLDVKNRTQAALRARELGLAS